MKLQYSYYCRAGEQVGRNWQLRAQDRVDADMHAERRCRSPVAEQLVRTPLNAASPRPRDARNAASLIAGRRRPSPTQQQPPRHLPPALGALRVGDAERGRAGLSAAAGEQGRRRGGRGRGGRGGAAGDGGRAARLRPVAIMISPR